MITPMDAAVDTAMAAQEPWFSVLCALVLVAGAFGFLKWTKIQEEGAIRERIRVRAMKAFDQIMAGDRLITALYALPGEWLYTDQRGWVSTVTMFHDHLQSLPDQSKRKVIETLLANQMLRTGSSDINTLIKYMSAPELDTLLHTIHSREVIESEHWTTTQLTNDVLAFMLCLPPEVSTEVSSEIDKEVDNAKAA